MPPAAVPVSLNIKEISQHRFEHPTIESARYGRRCAKTNIQCAHDSNDLLRIFCIYDYVLANMTAS